MNRKLYIQIFSIHGLVRYENPELGRDADTGGQVKYVLEMAEALSWQSDVLRVDLFTRLIRDKETAEEYGKELTIISDKFRIVRIQCGGLKYIRKELLWPHLDEYLDKTIKFIEKEGAPPDLVHCHYADAGHVGIQLSLYFDIPFVFTGHSLGLPKKQALMAEGMGEDEINRKYRMERRVESEEEILGCADLIITSTREEIRKQYGMYRKKDHSEYRVLPPGINCDRFFPRNEAPPLAKDDKKRFSSAGEKVEKELSRFFREPEKPMVVAICRADRKKNIKGLIEAYGKDRELQNMANLAVFAGLREDISGKPEGARSVLTEILLLMDKYDLYGKIAVPKKHDSTYEVAEIYRIAAEKRGVFVNVAFTEPFGLTLTEASACGLPVVATRDGGPREIIKNCKNGVLVNPSDPSGISSAVKKIIKGKRVWGRLSSQGIEGVKNNYRWDAHVKKGLKEMKRLVFSGKSDRRKKSVGHPVGDRLTNLKYLIISDIDNTLTGDTLSLERLMELLSKNRETIGFAVATGRSVDSAYGLIKERGLLMPDIFITSVGSEMYYGEKRIPDRGWQTHIARNWNRERVKDTLSGIDFLIPQEEENQGPCKLSYYMENRKDRLLYVHEALLENRCHYSLIYSGGRFLDILPVRASKGKAMRFLGYKWGVALSNMLVCGDSGNDLQMFKGSTLGVVVGNHTSELADLKGRRNVYFSENNYAAGIIEGIAKYDFIELSRQKGGRVGPCTDSTRSS